MEQANQVRPKLLVILIYLSFIGSFWNMFVGLGNALSEPNTERYESFMGLMDKFYDGNSEMEIMMRDQASDYISNINQNIVNFGAVEFMLNAISLIGVYLMFKNRRIGFTVYMIVQLLMLGVPIYFGSYNFLTVGATIFYAFITMIFFALYSTQLKYLED